MSASSGLSLGPAAHQYTPKERRSVSQRSGVGEGSGSLHSAFYLMWSCSPLASTVFSVVSPLITVLEASPTQIPSILPSSGGNALVSG